MTEQPPEGLTLSLIQKVMASLPEPERLFYIESEFVPHRHAYWPIPRMDDPSKVDIVCHPTMVTRLQSEFWPTILKPLDAEECERRFQQMLEKRIAAMWEAR